MDEQRVTERTSDALIAAADEVIATVRELLRALPSDFPDVENAIAEYEWQRHGTPKPDDEGDYWDDEEADDAD